MNGTDYVAVVGLYTKEGKALAVPGETCARIPDESLGWLLEGGYIEPAPAVLPREEFTPPPPARRTRRTAQQGEE